LNQKGEKEAEMEWLGIILNLLPSIIKVVESVFSKVPKSGAQKKAAAMDGLSQFAKGMEAISTGGQKDTWKAINENMPAIDSLIDTSVTAMNNMGILSDIKPDDEAYK